MTTIYQWFSLPARISVRCPACRGEASLERHGRLDTYSPIEGRLTCTRCHATRERAVVGWPEDAFFRCDVRGQSLWAWSKEHARAIRDYVQSSKRDPKAHPGFLAALMHLPRHFVLAKNRTATVKALDELLARNVRQGVHRVPPNKPFQQPNATPVPSGAGRAATLRAEARDPSRP
jgi:hypothetical protein